MSKAGSPSDKASNSRTAQVFRLALGAFGIGILAGQCATRFHNDSSGSDVVVVPNEAVEFTGTTKLERAKQKYGPFKRIALLGERNSGTTWISQQLKDCFASENMIVTTGLTKDKHFFQRDDGTIPRETAYVIAMVRNPYDWAAAMNKRPHHSPEHLKLDIEEFLTKPWTMERPAHDLPFANYTGPFCQLGYRYFEIIPCIRDENAKEEKPSGYSSRDPQYELRPDGSGLPFDSLLQLRQAKIKNILDVKDWDWVADFEIVQYEELLKHGTEAFLKHIADVTGVEMKCKPSPPAPERLSNYEQSSKVTRLINSLVDWDVEKSVGYSKKSA
eukprot:scaffold1284_cov108-Cylindrotheca_fusiformis.AAC.17